MADLIRDLFPSLPRVRSVEVRGRDGEFTVEITVSDFDRAYREAIYNRERELFTAFPSTNFDFYVLDGSLETAVA